MLSSLVMKVSTAARSGLISPGACDSACWWGGWIVNIFALNACGAVPEVASAASLALRLATSALPVAQKLLPPPPTPPPDWAVVVGMVVTPSPPFAAEEEAPVDDELPQAALAISTTATLANRSGRTRDMGPPLPACAP